jgi:hypothetical protein
VQRVVLARRQIDNLLLQVGAERGFVVKDGLWFTRAKVNQHDVYAIRAGAGHYTNKQVVVGAQISVALAELNVANCWFGLKVSSSASMG